MLLSAFLKSSSEDLRKFQPDREGPQDAGPSELRDGKVNNIQHYHPDTYSKVFPFEGISIVRCLNNKNKTGAKMTHDVI